jgi:hypothetical protein
MAIDIDASGKNNQTQVKTSKVRQKQQKPIRRSEQILCVRATDAQLASSLTGLGVLRCCPDIIAAINQSLVSLANPSGSLHHKSKASAASVLLPAPIASYFHQLLVCVRIFLPCGKPNQNAEIFLPSNADLTLIRLAQSNQSERGGFATGMFEAQGRLVIGFVTCGLFGMQGGYGVGIGFCSLNKLMSATNGADDSGSLAITPQLSGNIVMLRNPTEPYALPAIISVV